MFRLGMETPAQAGRSGRSAAWLARLVRDQEVDGSNPFAPTTSFLESPGASNEPTCMVSLERRPRSSFAVGYPDVLDLNGVVEEPAAFALFDVKPIDGAAFVGEHLFQISHGKCFCGR